MSFIDFTALKSDVRIEDVASMLSLSAVKTAGQLRAPCPACKSGGDRALVITPAKQAFYCFAARVGGDLIALVAHVQGTGVKDAAQEIARHFGRNSTSSRNNTSSGNSTLPQGQIGRAPRHPDSGRDPLRPLDYLLAEHDSVQSLGVPIETARDFGAGYAPKGIMRGRVAIPIRDRAGMLLAYCGRAISDDQQPRLIFPNGFRPETVIFNADRIQSGPLYLVRDPINVLAASSSGIDNVVAFLVDIAPQNLEMLASLMDEIKCESVELF